MKRPEGRLGIQKTRILSRDVLLAKLSGASTATVGAVRYKKKYYLVAPKKLGGVTEVVAGSLTDCVNWAVMILGEKKAGPKKGSRK